MERELEDVRQRVVNYPFAHDQDDTWRAELSQLPDGTARLHLAISLVVPLGHFHHAAPRTDCARWVHRQIRANAQAPNEKEST